MTTDNSDITYKEFVIWLEEEYPFHSHWDHDTLGEYNRWLREQEIAFRAGFSSASKAIEIIRSR